VGLQPSKKVKHRNSNIPINKDTTFILKTGVPDTNANGSDLKEGLLLPCHASSR